MSDEQVIKLLEEIRDLQKLHVENYKDALKNQQESIDLQKRAARLAEDYLIRSRIHPSRPLDFCGLVFIFDAEIVSAALSGTVLP